jgi:hypothetical protein
MSHGASRTLELLRMRLAFPDVASVITTSSSPSRATHTGVATADPSFLKVVRDRYLPVHRRSISGCLMRPPSPLRRDSVDTHCDNTFHAAGGKSPS